MPSVRLTNFDREDIRDRALKSAFETRAAELDKREHALANEAYEAVIPADERAKAGKLPTNWLRRDPCLNFNVAGSTVRLSTGGEGLPVPYAPKGSGGGTYGCHSRLGVIQAGDLADRIMSLMADRETLKEERRKAHAALQAMLASINTTGKLVETWPEGRPFFGHLEAARDKAAVPSVRVAEVNALLGIQDAA